MTGLPSFAQERFWFLDRLAAGNAAHTLQQSYLIAGSLRPDALDEAVRAVLRRHEVLRSRYSVTDDEIRIDAEPVPRNALRVEDLSGAPDPDERARQRVLDDAFAPFDLVAGGLFRALLLRLAPRRHVLVFSAHRAVFDEASFAVLERDVGVEYERALRSVGAGPDLAVSYADYARAQRAIAAGGGEEADLRFWRDALSGAPRAVDLPVDLSRPPIPSYRAREIEFEVPAGAPDALRAAGFAPETAALAALGMLLGRYSRADEVVVGVEVDARSGARYGGYADLVGSFTAHLPIRIAGHGAVGEVADRAGEAVGAAREHGDVPFDRLAAEVDHDHDLSRHPIFQVIFAYGPAAPEPALAGLAVTRRPLAVRWSRVDLELHLAETAGGRLTGRLRYAEDLFDAATVHRMVGHYLAMLAALSGTPAVDVSAVDMLAPAELRHMLQDWNPTDPALLSERTMSELFEEQARATPDRVAVRFGERTLTYRALNRSANRLATHLTAAGVGPEVIVGLYLRRGLPMTVAVLAILKAGGAYLPLDTQNPAARNEYLLTDAGAALVLTQAELVGKLPPVDGTRPVVLEEIEPRLGDLPDGDLPQRAGADSMIYVIYTSGSTGRPKGVVMTHRPLANLIRWQLRRTPISGPTLQFSSIGFDISFEEMFATWLAGGELVLIAEDDRRDPERMLEVMRRGRVRRLYCPPMVLEQLAHVAGDDLPPLAEIITAGEALHLTPEVRGLLARLGDVVLDNQYGPTEAHVITGHRMTGPANTWPTHPPVGATVTNARVYVLDENLRPVPIGGTGEVCVGGVCLARGYLGRPELTRERFLPDPYAPEPGARLYRTGDLGRWQADGTLLFLGRVDEQVKIRGYRVEPGEIEAALRTNPATADCAVLPVQHAADRRLAAYVVRAPGATATAADLRADLRRTLPEYMVPTYLTFLDRIPLTPVGKIDRGRLPDPTAPDEHEPDERPLAPGAEQLIGRIWCAAIGLDRVGPEENFFEIGGHSLVATKVVARIRQEMSVPLSVRTLFEHSTVAALAAAVEAVAADAAHGGAAGTPVDQLPALITPRGDRRFAPLSPIQHGLWLLHQLHTDCVAYHLPICFELTGELDTAALDRALTMLVARHETLRTGFAMRAGEPVQRIADPAPAAFEEVDLRGVAAADRAAALERDLADRVRTPFDLAEPRLWRAVRYRLAGDRHALMLLMHHIVSDGWSMEIIKRELSLAYAGARADRAPDWPPLPVQFGDLAAWEAGPRVSARMAAEVEFWRDQLIPAQSAPALPTRIRSGAPGFAAESVRGRLDGATVGAVRDIATEANASTFSVLLSAFALVLARYSGTDEMPVGAPLTVRDHPMAEDAVGFFTNTMVLRCQTRDGTFLDLVRRTQRRVIDALAHPHVPFEVIVSELAPRRDAHRNPLFDVWFNLLNFARHELSLDGVRVAPLRVPLPGALFDLGAYLRDDGDGMDVELVYRPTVFPADRVRAVLAHYLAVIRRVCAAPQTPVDEIRLPVDRVARTDFVGGGDLGLVDRVRAAAAARPLHPAVESAGAQLSYVDLIGAVDRLAETLPGAGDAVALATGRTPELVTGVLGARAAGAAFCVLDPDAGADRRRDQIGQLRPRALIDAGGAVREQDDPPDRPVLPTGAAYVSFTSGTTGRPLGVVGAEAPLTAFFDWYATMFELGDRDRFAVLAGLSHDPLLREVLLPLCLGATVCLPSPAALATPESVVRWLIGARCTVVHLTPARGRVLAATARSAGLTAPDVRLVVFGGAAVSPADDAAIRGAFPRARVISLYGSTETPQGISVVDLDTEFGAGGERLEPPLGAGSPSAELLVLGAGGRVAAWNEVGEVGVRSPHLVLEYLGEPGLTADRFRPDVDGQPGVRVYRTGDIGRYRPDGTVEFLGRADDQLSLAGARVEPAEIERVARGHPAVADCVALPHRGRLVLAVGRHAGPRDPAPDDPALDDPALDDIDRYLAERLSPTMIPDAVVPVAEIPLTPNGKVDRERVRAAVADQVDRAAGPGEQPVLDAVTDVWRQVLDVTDIDPDVTFFAVGGTSLTLLRAHRLLRERFDEDLELADLFQYQTVRRLAGRLAGDAAAGAPTGARRRSWQTVRRIHATRTAARQASDPARKDDGDRSQPR